MNYFQLLGTLLGLAAFLKPIYLLILPKNWRQTLLKVYTIHRPRWILPLTIVGFLIVFYTWWYEYHTDLSHSWFITLILSASALKGMTLIFNYHRFQKLVAKLLSENQGKKTIYLDSAISFIGILLLYWTWLILP